MGNKVSGGFMTTYSQTFTYDGLNRLSSASDSGGWSRTFQYDQYGNAWVPPLTGIGYGVSTPAWNVYNTNNRVGSSPYDNAGDILALPPGYGFTCDAENRIAQETNSGGLGANYYYDGFGERVEKVLSNGQRIVYVRDAFGQLAEECSPANTWSKDNIWLGGQMMAIENASANPCGTCFLSRDQLGTARMVTDPSTNIITRHDHLPFGDEIPAGSASRNSQYGPYADNVNQKFTGQYRDTETLNDFFGARYYTAPLMRFLNPDPAGLAAVDPSDPQTWNRYTYVRNNPLALVDPSGMTTCTQSNQYCGFVVFNTPSSLGLSGFETWDPFYWLSNSSATGAGSSSGSWSQQSATIIWSPTSSETLNFPPLLDVDALSSSIFIDSFGGGAGGSPPKNLTGPFTALDCGGYKAARSVLPQTKAQGIEFGGFIYENSQSSSYFYSAPFGGTPGALPSFDVHRTQDTPSGFSLAGWYHSHPLVPNYPHPELFSGADVGATRRVGGPGYLLTPNGAVLKLLPYPPNLPVAPTPVSPKACQGG